MKTITNSTIITKDKDIVCKELDGVTYLLHPHELTIHTLNDTASCIWRALAKKTTIDALVRAVTETFSVTEKIAKRDVVKFVKQYIAHGMVHIKSA